MAEPSQQKMPFWRAPIVHFLFLGGLVFGLDQWVSTPSSSPSLSSDTITVSSEYIQELKAALATNKKNPTSAALKAEVDRFIDQEILVREARKLGLDRGDMVVRRRLIQKMSFIVNDMAEAQPPTQDEMADWLSKNLRRYQSANRFSIEHVYFARERRGADAARDAKSALDGWRSRKTHPKGDPFLGGTHLKGRSLDQLSRQFGASFANAVGRAGQLPNPSGWFGPLLSPFGHHLVRIISLESPDAPTLDTVRSRIRSDMLEERRRIAAGQARTKLRKKYRVNIEGSL